MRFIISKHMPVNWKLSNGLLDGKLYFTEILSETFITSNLHRLKVVVILYHSGIF